MYKNKKIGVVIPAYNEAKFIADVVTGLPDYIDKVFIIDDCSNDSTAEIASILASLDPERIQVSRHESNSGVGKAIVTGYKNCLASNIDIAVVMAGDNQMDPAQLPALLEPISSGEADYTVGDRISNIKHMKGMSIWRRTGNWILRWLTRIAAGNFSISDPQNGYTAITQQTLSRLDLDSIYPRYGYCNDILVKLSIARARIKQIPMPAVYGKEKSKIRYQKYIPTVSWLLFRSFLFRMKVQLFQRNYYSTYSAKSNIR